MGPSEVKEREMLSAYSMLSDENTTIPQFGGKLENNISLISEMSDHFFSQCPEEESENVLFCYYLPSQQYEQVVKDPFKFSFEIKLSFKILDRWKDPGRTDQNFYRPLWCIVLLLW